MKAFDTVPHQRLLAILSSYGIVGKTLEWIKSFLTSRRQRVVVNGEVSDWSNVTSGVPQGSVLGPILFLCYINDLPPVIPNKVKVFADDTKIYSEVDNVKDCRNLQKDLDQISDWSKGWELKFHPQRCKILRIGKKNPTFDYFMTDSDGNEIMLDIVDQEKDLGVTIDKELTFRQHADLTVSKANGIMGLIRRSFTYIDESSFSMLFKTPVRPILEYNNTIWNPRFKSVNAKIESVQRRATNMIHGTKNLSYPERLKAVNLPTLAFGRLRGDMIQVCKYLNGKYDVANTQLFSIDQRGFHNTRGHHLKLVEPGSRLIIRKNFFTERCISTWNSLPETVVQVQNLNIFKNRLDKHWEDQKLKLEFFG